MQRLGYWRDSNNNTFFPVSTVGPDSPDVVTPLAG